MPRITLKSLMLTSALVVFGAGVARAQGEGRKWEVGFQFSTLNATNGEAGVTRVVPCVNPPCPVVTTTSGGRQTEPGGGARVGYGFNRYVSVEGELNFFPRGRELRDLDFNGGRKVQGLFGVKVGRRGERIGVFVKARPGFVNFAEGDLEPLPVPCLAPFPQPLPCFEPRSRTDFAFDVGGVFELYPSARTVVRLDAGDTILRTAAHRVPLGIATFNGVALPVPSATTHNFQGSVGFGFRF